MKKKIILGLAFISLLISFCFIGESYAKYVTNVNNVASMSVARWKILVNNKDILNKNEASQIITPIFLENLSVRHALAPRYSRTSSKNHLITFEPCPSPHRSPYPTSERIHARVQNRRTLHAAAYGGSYASYKIPFRPV